MSFFFGKITLDRNTMWFFAHSFPLHSTLLWIGIEQHDRKETHISAHTSKHDPWSFDSFNSCCNIHS